MYQEDTAIELGAATPPLQDTSNDGASEVSTLFYQAFTQVAEGMNEVQKTEYLTSLFDDGEIETERTLFEHIVTEQSAQLPAPNYHPDRAVREASLARKDQWKPTDGGELSYVASNDLAVYLAQLGRPLCVSEALKEIRKLSESTVLTARIVLGLWNTRRYNKQVSKEGSVAILLDEILQWQGHQKHSRVLHVSEEGGKRYTDGYRTEHKQRVVQDLALLAACYVRGTCPITLHGKTTEIEVDGPYLRYDTVSRKTIRGEKIILGFLISPGGWVSTYEQHQIHLLAQIDSQIFRLNPQNDRYALRLALYLTERWREQAREKNFSQPITMTDLLAASMIEAEKRHLTSEIAPRIESALQNLEAMGVIGKQQRLIPVDTTKARWGKEWLAAWWEILPPLHLVQAYQAVVTPPKKKRPKTLTRGKQAPNHSLAPQKKKTDDVP